MISINKYPFIEHNSYNFNSDFFRLDFVRYCLSEGVCLIDRYICKKDSFDVIHSRLSSLFLDGGSEPVLDLFGMFIGNIFADEEGMEHITKPTNRRDFFELMCKDFIMEHVVKTIDPESKMFDFEKNPFHDPTIPPCLIVVLNSSKHDFFKNFDARAKIIHP